MRRYLVLDYETKSEASLKELGAYQYAQHPTTDLICAAWRCGTKKDIKHAKTESFHTFDQTGQMIPISDLPYDKKLQALGELLEDSDTIVVAHNAFFEYVITRFVLGIDIPPDRWVCTASLAAALALPRNLEDACLAIGANVQKDMEGRRLMLKYTKPRKPTKNNPNRWHNDVEELRRVVEYCRTDIDAEVELLLKLNPLSKNERKLWKLDQRINANGFKVDTDLVHSALALIDEESTRLNGRLKEITDGEIESATRRQAMLEFVQANSDYPIENLQAKTITDVVELGLMDGVALEALKIRQAVSKTSTAKFKTFRTRADESDSRIRDILMYHGASTGRWTGTGIQPQNFPRGTIKITGDILDVIKSQDLELLRMLYGSPMEVLSSALRSCIIASEGKEFFCGDYSAIEARVLFWMAEHALGLKAYHEDRPIYEEMAQVIYLIDHVENVDSDQRQTGKQAILGCGYGMGAEKFYQTCLNYGIVVDEMTAEMAVTAYRTTHRPVVTMWSNLEKAAIAAVVNPGKRYTINKTSWHVRNGFLWCQLPSGRFLAYYGPEIRYRKTPWGEKRPCLYHYGVNPITRKWHREGTYGGRLTENVVQAVARDFMAEAMLRMDAADYDIVLTVHDELLTEKDKGTGSLDEFIDLMAAVPEWGEGCPIKVEGWAGERYKK